MIDDQREWLGEYADHGYYVQVYEDAIAVGYKDKEFAAHPKHLATPEILQTACRRHEARLREPVGVKK